jgi:hypothetical protein
LSHKKFDEENKKIIDFIYNEMDDKVESETSKRKSQDNPGKENKKKKKKK